MPNIPFRDWWQNLKVNISVGSFVKRIPSVSSIKENGFIKVKVE
jgi:hypothetical protein